MHILTELFTYINALVCYVVCVSLPSGVWYQSFRWPLSLVTVSLNNSVILNNVVFLSSPGRAAHPSLYSQQAGVLGFRRYSVERYSASRHISAVTRGFQTASQDVLVFPVIPCSYLTHNLITISASLWTLSLIHIWRCRRSTLCRSRWSPYH